MVGIVILFIDVAGQVAVVLLSLLVDIVSFIRSMVLLLLILVAVSVLV